MIRLFSPVTHIQYNVIFSRRASVMYSRMVEIKWRFFFVGYQRDISGSYLISLYGAAGIMILVLVLCSVSMVLHSRIKATGSHDITNGIPNITDTRL